MIASYVEKLHSFFVCMFCSLSLDCPVWPSCPETRSDYQAGLVVKDPFASHSVVPDVLLSLGSRTKGCCHKTGQNLAYLGNANRC